MRHVNVEVSRINVMGDWKCISKNHGAEWNIRATMLSAEAGCSVPCCIQAVFGGCELWVLSFEHAAYAENWKERSTNPTLKFFQCFRIVNWTTFHFVKPSQCVKSLIWQGFQSVKLLACKPFCFQYVKFLVSFQQSNHLIFKPVNLLICQALNLSRSSALDLSLFIFQGLQIASFISFNYISLIIISRINAG